VFKAVINSSKPARKGRLQGAAVLQQVGSSPLQGTCFPSPEAAVEWNPCKLEEETMLKGLSGDLGFGLWGFLPGSREGWLMFLLHLCARE